MKDLLYTHWKLHNTFLDYFTIDYSLRIFYERSSTFRQEVERDKLSADNIYALFNSLNEVYDAKVMDDIEASIMFSKLSYKGQLNPSINGKQTFYGHIISEYE